jgi:hypothetical protein
MPTLQRILGSLKAFQPYNKTPVIGTRFPSPKVQLSHFLNASNSSELIRDLAVTVSHRGVVFFTDQDINLDEQKELARRMGELTGRPSTSGLHRHPISESAPELAEVSVIDSEGCAIISIACVCMLNFVASQRYCTRWHYRRNTRQQWVAL